MKTIERAKFLLLIAGLTFNLVAVAGQEDSLIPPPAGQTTAPTDPTPPITDVRTDAPAVVPAVAPANDSYKSYYENNLRQTGVVLHSINKWRKIALEDINQTDKKLVRDKEILIEYIHDRLLGIDAPLYTKQRNKRTLWLKKSVSRKYDESKLQMSVDEGDNLKFAKEIKETKDLQVLEDRAKTILSNISENDEFKNNKFCAYQRTHRNFNDRQTALQQMATEIVSKALNSAATTEQQ